MNEELKGIIDSMVAAGENQEAINMVIAKYEAENTQDVQVGKDEAAAEETATVVAETPANTDLQSEIGSLESQTPSTFAQSELEKNL